MPAATRAKNANTHPGLIVQQVTSMRASRADTAAAKAKKAQVVSEKKASEKEKLAAVHKLEALIAQEDADDELQASLSPPMCAHTGNRAGSPPSGVEPLNDTDPSKEDPMSTDSSDDFMPIASDLTQDTMGIDNGGNEDNEEETPKPKRKRGKKSKGDLRKETQAVLEGKEKGNNPSARVDLTSDPNEVTGNAGTKGVKNGNKKSDKSVPFFHIQPGSLTGISSTRDGHPKSSAALVPSWLQSIEGFTQMHKGSKPTITNTKPVKATPPTAPPSRVASSSSRTTSMNPVMVTDIKKEPNSNDPRRLSRDPVLLPSALATELTKVPTGITRVPTLILETDDVDIGFGMPTEFMETEHDAALSSPIKGSDVRLSHNVGQHVSGKYLPPYCVILGYHICRNTSKTNQI